MDIKLPGIIVWYTFPPERCTLRLLPDHWVLGVETNGGVVDVEATAKLEQRLIYNKRRTNPVITDYMSPKDLVLFKLFSKPVGFGT